MTSINPSDLKTFKTSYNFDAKLCDRMFSQDKRIKDVSFRNCTIKNIQTYIEPIFILFLSDSAKKPPRGTFEGPVLRVPRSFTFNNDFKNLIHDFIAAYMAEFLNNRSKKDARKATKQAIITIEEVVRRNMIEC